MSLGTPWCLLIAGGIASGKTTVAANVAIATGAQHLRVRQALVEVLALRDADRRTLQVEGAALDRRTSGRWLLDYMVARVEGGVSLVVDAMRTRAQTAVLLEGLVNSRLVYLDAALSTQVERFRTASLSDPVKRSMSLESSLHHDTEQAVLQLRALADLVIETDDLSVSQTVQCVLDFLASAGG